MTSISKRLHSDELDYIDNKYGNTYPKAIKIKPIDFKASKFFSLYVENKDKDPKFNNVGYHVRIENNKNIFGKSFILYLSEDVAAIKRVKNTVP